MKKLLLAGMLACGMAASAFGQGAIFAANWDSQYGPMENGDWFWGTYSFQVWVLNSSTIPSNINCYNGVSPMDAYNNLISDGYQLEFTITNQYIPEEWEGDILYNSEIFLPDVRPAGATVAIAIVMWDNAASDLPTALAQGGAGGVVTFENPTVNYTIMPPPIPPFLDGWDSIGQNLILVP